MDKAAFRELPNPLYLVTWKAGYPDEYLGRVYDNKFVALKVCEPDQVVIELRLAASGTDMQDGPGRSPGGV